MARLLQRVGLLAARRAWSVIAAWAVLAAIAAGGFLAGFGGLTNSFDIPGTASGEVLEDLEEGLPGFGGASGTIVFHTTDGSPFTPDQQDAIAAIIEDARGLDGIEDVIDPFEADRQRQDGITELEDGRDQLEQGRDLLESGQGAAFGITEDQLDAGEAQLAQGEELLALADGIGVLSEDGDVALAAVSFTDTRLELPEETTRGLMDRVSADPVDGVAVEFSTDISQEVPEVLGLGEVVGVAIAAVVLLVVLGSALAAAFPVVTAIVGVALGAMATLAFSGVVQMASVTPVLGVMLGLAVGIDYSLFILHRHRRQLIEGMPVHASIGLANGTAGNAVVFAGSTVVIALLALNVTGIPFLGLMGTAGAVSVTVAVLIATTLTPALLGLAGTRILGRRAARRPAPTRTATGHAGMRVMSTTRAWTSVVLTVVVLLVAAIPALSMRLGLPDGGSEPEDSTAYRAHQLIATSFGEGATGPLLVTARHPAPVPEEERLAAQVEVARTIGEQEGVVAVAPIAVSPSGELMAFQVIPTGGPNSLGTEALVQDLRDLPPVQGEITLGVAGQAAINGDISQGLADVLPLYLAMVVGLSFLIMMMVFRSLLVPLIATAGFILSLVATYGVVTAVFQWGWFADVFGVHTPGPILSFLPVILVGILFGLAMDYQLFLTSGMREAYAHGSPARRAVAEGLAAGRVVVTAAALIMIAVFAGFITADSPIIKALGLGLALGVALDAFLVRMTLVPALLHLVGPAAWWFPRWLDRLVPDVDVEGSRIRSDPS